MLDRLALDKSYVIMFFLGLDPETPDSQLNQSKAYVGMIATLSSGGRATGDAAVCPKCARQHAAGSKSRAQVPITNHLLSRAIDDSNDSLNDLLGSNVGQYLKDNLSWKVFKAGREPVEMQSEEMKDLKIFALQGVVEHDLEDDSVLSTYRDYNMLWEATDGKPRGAQRGSDEGLW
jgi:hypothetical protein